MLYCSFTVRSTAKNLIWNPPKSDTCWISFALIRNDQPRGHPESGQVIPNGVSGGLSQGTLWDYDDVLEAKVRRTADFWIPAEHAERFLYRNRGTIWDAVVIKNKVRDSSSRKVLVHEWSGPFTHGHMFKWTHVFFCHILSECNIILMSSPYS